MLPKIAQKKLQDESFPCLWQAVLFRNYGMVRLDRLARVLECDENTLQTEALRLGLDNVIYDKQWEEAGYLTLIRQNWYLLNYKQLLTLLDFTEDKLDFILKEEDFLYVKLGFEKPACENIIYTPLTQEQIRRTEEIAALVRTCVVKPKVKPFDFFANDAFRGQTLACAIDQQDGLRLIHGYVSPCGDAFSVDCDTYLTDELLTAYQKQGINAVFIHAVLSSLSYYPFKPSLSQGYEKRRAEIKRIIQKLKKYGMKLYFYINEPRGLPTADFGKYAYLIGDTLGDNSALCFSHKDTRDYLYNAIKDLLIDVKDLGGLMTCTMSENLTHCKSNVHEGRETLCPVCKNIPSYKLASDVNNVIMQAIKDSGTETKLLANLWGWSPFMGFTEEDLKKGIANLDKDIGVLLVSEFDLQYEKGGIKQSLVDYSISNPGPSDYTKLGTSIAKEYGHNVYAKIQVCNSWECSCVPYLPVFDLIKEHLDNLSKADIDEYMLSWTLGGYPAPNLGLIAAHKAGQTLDEWYATYYGEHADIVHKAVKTICQGFKNYPFAIGPLYNSPKTLGPANLWSKEREYNTSTMTCYSFDDYENWINPYPYATYVSLLEELLRLWKDGIEILKTAKTTPQTHELLVMAEVSYIHFEADLLQTKFSYLKRDWDKNKEQIREVLLQAKVGAKRLIELVHNDARIGFEAANHYFYTDRTLTEKLLNLDNILKTL